MAEQEKKGAPPEVLAAAAELDNAVVAIIEAAQAVEQQGDVRQLVGGAPVGVVPADALTTLQVAVKRWRLASLKLHDAQEKCSPRRPS